MFQTSADGISDKARRYPPAPLFWPAVAFMAGILAARMILPAVWVPAVLLGVSLLGSGWLLIWQRRIGPRLRTSGIWALLLAGFLSAGALRYYFNSHYLPARHILFACQPERRLATLRGRIVTEPYIAETKGPFARFDRIHEPQTIFTLRAEEAKVQGGWREISGLVHVVIAQPALALRCGQTVQMDGWLSLRRGPGNWGEYDRRDSYAASQKWVRFSVNYAEAAVILHDRPDTAGLWQRFHQKLQNLAYAAVIDETLLAAEEEGSPYNRKQENSPAENTKGLLSALLLGQCYDISDRLVESFMRTGTIHVLSVSGLHIGLFSLFVWWLGRLLHFPRWLRGGMALLCIFIYLLIVPCRPPVLRAGIISVVFCIAYMLRRQTNMINLLALAVLIILLLQPMDLFNPGFQLSFLAVLALFLFVPAVYKGQFSFRSSDFLPLDAHPWWQLHFDEPLPWRQYALRILAHHTGQLAITSLIASLVALPLVAYHFHRITPWATVCSVVLAPLIWITMMLGFTKLFLAVLSPLLSHLCSGPLYAIGDWVVHLTEKLALLPLSNLHTASPPLGLLVIFYLILTAAAWAVYEGRRVPRVLLYGLLVWFAFFLWLFPFAKDYGKNRACLEVLSVGHGCAVFVQLPDGKVICFDAGSRNYFNIGASTIVPVLRSRGINRIDALLVSHANIDHFCGVLDLCQNFPVAGVYVSDRFNRPEESSAFQPAADVLLRELKNMRVPVHRISRGHAVFPAGDSPEDYQLEVLWPPAPGGNYKLDENDASLVLRIGDTRHSMLLCGDIGPVSQRLLMRESPARLKSDILVVPHHGSVGTNRPEFLQAVGPAFAVISSGFLEPEDVAALQNHLPPCRLVSTWQNGAVRFAVDPEEIQMRTHH